MKTKLTLTVIIILLVCVAGMVFTKRMQSAKHSADFSTAAADGGIAVPTSVLYDRMFRLIVSIRAKSKIQELRGERVTSLKSYFKDEARLSDEQNEILGNKAIEFVEAVRPTDDEATEIVSRVRTLYPDGRVPEGKAVPPPPAELEGLQSRRDELALKYREQLNKALGAEKFKDLDEFIHGGFAASFQSIPLSSIPESAGRGTQ